MFPSYFILACRTLAARISPGFTPCASSFIASFSAVPSDFAVPRAFGVFDRFLLLTGAGGGVIADDASRSETIGDITLGDMALGDMDLGDDLLGDARNEVLGTELEPIIVLTEY